MGITTFRFTILNLTVCLWFYMLFDLSWSWLFTLYVTLVFLEFIPVRKRWLEYYHGKKPGIDEEWDDRGNYFGNDGIDCSI